MTSELDAERSCFLIRQGGYQSFGEGLVDPTTTNLQGLKTLKLTNRKQIRTFTNVWLAAEAQAEARLNTRRYYNNADVLRVSPLLYLTFANGADPFSKFFGNGFPCYRAP